MSYHVGNGLTEFQQSFVNGAAKSLGYENVFELARKLGFSNEQELADHYGFKNVFLFFSSPGNAERYADLEIELIAKAS